MIHNHSSGKHRLLRKILAVCIAFAMICSVSISAFAVEASSETVNENSETVQSGSAEESEELTATESENEQPVDETQPEEPSAITGDEDTEEPAEVIEAPSEDTEELSVEPGEDTEQPADPTVTEQPEEPTVTEEPSVTPAEDVDASSDEVQDVEMEAQDAKAKRPTPTPILTTPAAYSGKAAIYYLSDPAGDPWTNDTGAWAPSTETSNTLGKINTDGATWEDGYVGDTVYKNKNIKSNVPQYITSWPDGSTGATWTVKSGDSATGTYFTYILNSIWNNYKSVISDATGIKEAELHMSDIEEITLTPRKISRDNGGTYPYHIDCALSIKSKKAFTAKFWVKEPGATDYTQVDAKNYKTGDSVAETGKATIGSKKEVNGITYVLEGWYPENDAGGAYKNQKIENWNYTPNTTELADGTVNFYARYKPLYTSVSIKKLVTGNMGDKSKKFNFTVSVKNGTTELPFKLGGTSCTGSAKFSLSDDEMIKLTEVPVEATVTITEDDYRNGRYTTSYTIGSSTPTTDRIATISGIQQLNNDENAAHEVEFTNNKEAIPDTGVDLNSTPYILMLGIMAAGVGVMLFGRRKRWS